MAARQLNRPERQSVEALEARLEHLQGEHPERTGDPAYPPGEAKALRWVIGVVLGIGDPIELRLERAEGSIRKLWERIGRIEADVYDDEED